MIVFFKKESNEVGRYNIPQWQNTSPHSEGPRNNFYKLSNFYQNFIQVRNGEKKLEKGFY